MDIIDNIIKRDNRGIKGIIIGSKEKMEEEQEYYNYKTLILGF